MFEANITDRWQSGGLYTVETEAAVLCGGRAARMGGLAASRQKCMLEVAGKPILAHVLNCIADAFGRGRAYLLTAYQGREIFEHFGFHYRGLTIRYIDSGEPTGTRLALLATKRSIKNDFLMMHGNVICSTSGLLELRAQFDRERPEAALLIATRYDEAPTHGLVTLDRSRVCRIDYPSTAKLPAHGKGRDMGVYFFNHSLFGHLANSREIETVTGVLQRLVLKGIDIRGISYETRWFHFAIPQDLSVQIDFE